MKDDERFRCKFSLDKSLVPDKLQQHGAITKLIRGLLPSIIEAVNQNPDEPDLEAFGKKLVVMSVSEYKAIKNLLNDAVQNSADMRAQVRLMKTETQLMLSALKKENSLSDVQSSILKLTKLCQN